MTTSGSIARSPWRTRPAAEAVREGEQSVAARPISQDAYTGAYHQHILVRVYLLAGQHEKALDRLEQLLEIPYFCRRAGS